MATNSDVINAQMEVVDPKLHEWFETSNKIVALVKKAAPSHRVSSFVYPGTSTAAGFRIPIMVYRGGDFGVFSYDEGDLGDGSGMKLVAMTVGYFPTKIGFAVSSLAAEATATSQQAVVNVFRKQLGEGLKELQAYDDVSFHQDGTGVIAASDGLTAPTGTTTYTLEPNFGFQRLRLNQPVDVYQNDLTATRGTNVRVASWNWAARTVTLSGTITGPALDDVLAFAGMSPTLSVGSYQNGLYTFNNSAASGTTLGLNRANYPEIVSPYITASGPLVPAHGLALKDQLIQRRDEEVLNGMIGIIHMAQRAAIYLSGIAISEWHRGASDKMIDITPSGSDYKTEVTWNDVKHYVSKRQDRSRVDWINPKLWGRVMIHETKFHEVEGRRIFELRGSNGNVKAGMRFFLIQAQNFYSADPGGGAFIGSLTLPPTY